MKSLYSASAWVSAADAAFLEPGIADGQLGAHRGIRNRDRCSAASAGRGGRRRSGLSSWPSSPCRRVPCRAAWSSHWPAGWRSGPDSSFLLFLSVRVAAAAPEPGTPTNSRRSSGTKRFIPPQNLYSSQAPYRCTELVQIAQSAHFRLPALALRLAALRAAASSARASCSGWPAPKTALPATSSSAPCLDDLARPCREPRRRPLRF